MATIPFPNVPMVPGVPDIPRSPSVPPEAQAVLGAVQGALWSAFQVDTRWGIFDSAGNRLADPGLLTGFIGEMLNSLGGASLSTGGVDYSKETRVSDFPVETGGFASYNKVELPSAPMVTLCMSGSESDRTAFLDAIDAACKSTDLYSIATPEVTYIDYSIERYSYSRHSSRGANLLIVELSLKEVRQVSAEYGTATTTAAAQPSATPTVDAGLVQAPAPDVSTAKSIATKLGF